MGEKQFTPCKCCKSTVRNISDQSYPTEVFIVAVDKMFKSLTNEARANSYRTTVNPIFTHKTHKNSVNLNDKKKSKEKNTFSVISHTL